jgi:hypothetical protein
MYAPYGARTRGNAVLPPSLCVSGRPPEAEKIECDRYPRCLGCPYPRHGLFCWSDENACLRTEMAAIYEKSRGRRLGAIAY